MGEPDAFALARRLGHTLNRPTLRGAYPDDVLPGLSPLAVADLVGDGDLATIAGTDMLGVNYYSRHTVYGRIPPGPGRAPEWAGSETAPGGTRTSSRPHAPVQGTIGAWGAQTRTHAGVPRWRRWRGTRGCPGAPSRA